MLNLLAFDRVKHWNVAVLVLILSWFPITGPIQIITYVGPVAVAGLALLLGRLRASKPDLIFLLVFASLAFVRSALYQDTGLLNPALGLLTYGSILLLAVRFEEFDRTFRGFVQATAIFSIIEGSIGAAQLIRFLLTETVTGYYVAGDFVHGTLGTNPQLYAAKMLFQSLLLLYVWFQARHTQEMSRRERRYILAGSAFAIGGAMLASSLAATFIFLAVVLGWTLAHTLVNYLRQKALVLRELATIIAWMALAAVFLVATHDGPQYLLKTVFHFTQTRNVSEIIGSQADIESEDRFNRSSRYIRKLIMLDESVREVLLDNPANATVGIGLGRYSSRAAMMLSGGYLRGQSWFPVSRSPETSHHIYRRWNPDTYEQYRGSALSIPTSSIQAALIEFGILGSVLFFGYYASVLYRSHKQAQRLDDSAGIQQFFLKRTPVFMLALFAMSFYEMWLEYAQLVSFIYIFVALALSGPLMETAKNPAGVALESRQASSVSQQS